MLCVRSQCLSLEPSWLGTGCLTIGVHETYSHQKSDLQIRCKTVWRHSDIHWVTLNPLENKANYKRWILTSLSPPFLPLSVKTSSLKCVNHLYLESPGAAYQKKEETWKCGRSLLHFLVVKSTVTLNFKTLWDLMCLKVPPCGQAIITC